MLTHYLKYLFLIYVLFSYGIMANSNLVKEANSEQFRFQILENKFIDLTSKQIPKLKEGSRPFIYSQHNKAPTVVMIHGLSDSPGSMKEAATVYFKLGYNVVTVLLRDHGLLKSYRNEARSEISLEKWREDIDQVMIVALQMSDSRKVALIGFSLGGALALDTANRYDGRISSIVLLAPLFKMRHSKLASLTKYLKYLKYSTQKGIDERPFFYPDIALNQTFQAYRLTEYLKNEVTKNPKSSLKQIPKIMFLTDADTTIVNDFAIETAKQLSISDANTIIYINSENESVALHRDLPMRILNANKNNNPFIDNLLFKLESFLITVD